MDRGAEQLQISRILNDLGSNQPRQAWTDFLELYSPVILQVVRLLEVDADHVNDCFLFVCQQLSHRNFRRLRRFIAEGPASFATWLRAVVRRLCLDWRRKEFGRARIFESIARLEPLDHEVFRCLYQDGVPMDEALLALSPRFPSLTGQELANSFRRVRNSLTPRQLWLLGTRRPRSEPLETAEISRDVSLLEKLRDPAPDPEALAARHQQHVALVEALARLPHSERLLVRLRFEQELTLEQVARLAGLADAQTADRRLRKILDDLRKQFGKTQSASV